MNRTVYFMGLLLGAGMLLPFSRLRIDGVIFEFAGSFQFLLVVMVMLVVAIGHFLRTGFRLTRQPVFLLAVAWMIVAFASAAFSPDPVLVVKRSLLAAGPAILLLLLTQDRNLNQQDLLRGLVSGLVIVTLLSVFWALSGLVGFWNSPHFARLSGWEIAGTAISQSTGQRFFTIYGEKHLWMRLAGFFPNPNGLGIVCVLVLGLSGLVDLRWRKFIILLLVAGILVTFSRTALLLLAVAATYLLLSTSPRLRGLFVATVSLTVLGLPFLVSDQATTILAGLLEMLGLSSQEALQLRERGESLIIAWQALPDYWLTGAGFGLGTEVLFDGATDKALHSVFFNAWIETGIIGMLLLAAMWLYPVWQARHVTAPTFRERLKEPRIVLPAILLGLFAAQAFDLSITRFHYVHLLFFTFLGLLTALNRREAGDNHA